MDTNNTFKIIYFLIQMIENVFLKLFKENT